MTPLRITELRNAAIIVLLALMTYGGYLFLSFNFSSIAHATASISYASAVSAVSSTPTARSASQSHVVPGAAVSFNFDDGYESAYLHALPILNAAGYKATIYVTSGYLGYSGYLNSYQLKAVSKEGHEIGSQGMSHQHFAQLTEEQAVNEMTTSRIALQGLGIGVKTFAFPYAENTVIPTANLQGAGYIGARMSSGTGANSASSTSAYALQPFFVTSNMTFTDVQKAIDQAAAQKQWIVLVFKRVDEQTLGYTDNVPHELIQQIVDYVKEQNIPVRTMSEGLAS